jgi:hypothetical protein
MTTVLGPIRQLAFVVDDIERAAHHWVVSQGAGPFFVYDVDIADTWYRGTPTRLWARMALGQLADQQIELVQPLDDASGVYREYLDAGGRGLHHVCYWHDVDAASDMLQHQGYDMVHHGVTPGGQQFAYLAGPYGTPYVEVVDPTAGAGAMAQFFARVATASQGWDGSDPVRGRHA